MQKWVTELCALPIDRLIADLNHQQFARREAATQKLARLGRLVEPDLRQALAGKPEPEARRRIERLLAQREAGPVGGADEGLRLLRAVEVLEHIASPEARALLTMLARQAPAAEVAQDARAALERLALQ
jgi:hypothetical protein